MREVKRTLPMMRVLFEPGFLDDTGRRLLGMKLRADNGVRCVAPVVCLQVIRRRCEHWCCVGGTQLLL